MTAHDVRLKINGEVFVTEFDGDLVLLSAETGTYFGIDGSGVRMWELLSDPITLAEIGEVIAAEFDVAPERARADAFAFCTELRGRGLVVEQG
jgi:hypothetical protein